MKIRIFFLLAVLTVGFPAIAQLRWPPITAQTKPWTRWWWLGSAVNDRDVTHLLGQYRQAGLGGVEITPIYGVQGTEPEFIDFLSPTWMDRLGHTLAEAKRLGLGVDLAQASGWPFGGPWVTGEDACKYVAFETYALSGGERLSQPVRYTQKPILRTVGEKIDLKNLVEPIAKNPNLQLHAFDQVRFEKPLPLQALMAYSDGKQPLDLTKNVAADGTLNWAAPPGRWTLYAVFQGWHGKMVERAGPGGEGDVIDHFSKTATQNYLRRFDEAFRGRDVAGIRAFFNDSYEVDDASGESNWTPALFAEFQHRRGYELKQHLPALFGKADDDRHQRVLSDFRETISELLLENYTQTWRDWAKTRGALIRNQAHGSPANILDLYAVTDIPEIEGTDILRIKFASSAAHVTGKPLTSSESATWDNEHFLSTLGDVKRGMDRFLLGGVNHTFYHGTAYSPPAAAWPGWLFYAAVHFNPQNPFWTDFGKLNEYVARCQAFLQAGKPANDVLVYLPIYDAFVRPGKVLLQHFDGIDHGFKGLPVGTIAESLWQRGYGFDFISDRQLLGVKTANGTLQTGGVSYRTVLVPDAKLLPLATLEKLLNLAQSGATVVFAGNLPADVPGLKDLEPRRTAFQKRLSALNFTATPGVQRAALGKGAVFLGKNGDEALAAAGVQRETLTDAGLHFIRRQHDGGHAYFVANGGEKPFAGWVALHVPETSVALYDPMTGAVGLARTRTNANRPEVYLNLAPGETCLLQTAAKPLTGPAFAYHEPVGAPQPLAGTWTVTFTSGGPELPAAVQTNELKSWTEWNGAAGKAFSGEATYTLTFSAPAGGGEGYLLDLGRVAESARVAVNGQSLGTLIGPTYRVFVPKKLLKPSNVLTVTVANGMANRISDLERRGVRWQRFYNINVSPRRRENRGPDGNFTAAKWDPLPSGLLGPVTLTAVGERE